MESQIDRISIITTAYGYLLLTKVDTAIKTQLILLLPSDLTTTFHVNDVTTRCSTYTYYT